MKDTGEMERTVAATFLLVHAVLLGVFDLCLALVSLLAGFGGVVLTSSSGLEDSALAFGLSGGMGLAAALSLVWALGEAVLAVRALRGNARSLLPVALASFLGSVLLLAFSFLSCGLLGPGLTLPMLLVSGISAAFAGLAISSPRS